MNGDACGDKRGTLQGARRHRKAKEKPCPDCIGPERDYVREYVRNWRKGNPQSRYRKTVAILTDLIEEQRELHHRFGDFCSLCTGEWPCQCVQSLDRAEGRLREVSGE